MGVRLKKLYNELVRLCGSRIAYKLFEKFSGEQINVARRDSPFILALEDLSSPETADLFHTRNKDTQQMYVGKAEGLLRHQRDRRIYADYKKGVPQNQMAKRYKITRQAIHQIIGRQKKKEEKSTKLQ